MSWRARFVGGPEDGVERPAPIDGLHGKPARTYMVNEMRRCRSCERAAFVEGAPLREPYIERHIYVAVAFFEERDRAIVVYAYHDPGCTITRC